MRILDARGYGVSLGLGCVLGVSGLRACVHGCERCANGWEG